eukprot:scaffold2034_cov113-Skeletonema_dohrnii-CCMP3373.AAC.15
MTSRYHQPPAYNRCLKHVMSTLKEPLIEEFDYQHAPFVSSTRARETKYHNRQRILNHGTQTHEKTAGSQLIQRLDEPGPYESADGD